MKRQTLHPPKLVGINRRIGRGFTLVEMMVAMLLGLIVIAGVSSVFLANLRSYHSNTALGNVQSNARIAFELMARDIRQAGLTGCNSTSGRISNVLANGPNNGGTDWWANWAKNSVHGYEAGDDDPAVTTGTTKGLRDKDTDSLQLMSAIGAGLSVADDQEPAANFKLNEASSDLQTGDMIMVCDPDHTAILQISDYTTGTNVTVGHNSGSGTPGNCSKGLGYPTVCGGTANGNIYTFARNSSVSKLGAHDWYIGINPEGGRSLYRVAITNSAGTLSTTAQEMVRNVTDMQIVYHQNNDAGYVDASAVTSWDAVNAVRITFTLQSADKHAGTDAKPLTRQFTTTTTIRNRVS